MSLYNPESKSSYVYTHLVNKADSELLTWERVDWHLSPDTSPKFRDGLVDHLDHWGLL